MLLERQEGGPLPKSGDHNLTYFSAHQMHPLDKSFHRKLRFRRNGDRALTTDITGRNLPSSTPYRHWVFMEALDDEKTTASAGRR